MSVIADILEAKYLIDELEELLARKALKRIVTMLIQAGFIHHAQKFATRLSIEEYNDLVSVNDPDFYPIRIFTVFNDKTYPMKEVSKSEAELSLISSSIFYDVFGGKFYVDDEGFIIGTNEEAEAVIFCFENFSDWFEPEEVLPPAPADFTDRTNNLKQLLGLIAAVYAYEFYKIYLMNFMADTITELGYILGSLQDYEDDIVADFQSATEGEPPVILESFMDIYHQLYNGVANQDLLSALSEAQAYIAQDDVEVADRSLLKAREIISGMNSAIQGMYGLISKGQSWGSAFMAKWDSVFKRIAAMIETFTGRNQIIQNMLAMIMEEIKEEMEGL